jgi:hypothetical protein
VLEAATQDGVVDTRALERAELMLQRRLDPFSPHRNGHGAVGKLEIDWSTMPPAPEAMPGPAEADAAPSAGRDAMPAHSGGERVDLPGTLGAGVAASGDLRPALRAEAPGPDAGAAVSEPGRWSRPEAAAPPRRDTVPSGHEPRPPAGSPVEAGDTRPLLRGEALRQAPPEQGSAAGTEGLPAEPKVILYRQGLQAMREQQYTRAVQLLSDAVAEDPESVSCWAALAQAYLLEGSDLSQAERCARRALQANDWDARMHLLLGHILRKSGRLEQAATALLRALELDHTNPQVHAALRSLQLR